MGKLQEFQKLVIANAKHIKGLKVDDKITNFTLFNAIGKSTSLSQ
jgi:hypothetical protein|tara:strand:- start:1703 stop:1837 length:135 start_codon:yes stop_codon:yes gene_type:complete